MIGILLQCLVVFCEIYCVLYVIALVIGIFNAGWRWAPLYPTGPNLVGSLFSFIVALTIAIVFGHWHVLSFVVR
jgi:hypothetical protein